MVNFQIKNFEIVCIIVAGNNIDAEILLKEDSSSLEKETVEVYRNLVIYLFLIFLVFQTPDLDPNILEVESVEHPNKINVESVNIEQTSAAEAVKDSQNEETSELLVTWEPRPVNICTAMYGEQYIMDDFEERKIPTYLSNLKTKEREDC